jgi:hypothetical protein
MDLSESADIERMLPSQLRIVIFPDTPRMWTARALEHDLSARGPSIEAALDTLLKIASAHVAYDHRHNHEPLSAFAPAPRQYWTAFPRGTRFPHELTMDWSTSGGARTQIIPAILREHPAIDARPATVLRSA